MHNYKDTDVFYFVTIRNKAYVEPDYSTYMRDLPADAILRVFEKKEDADRYRAIVEHYEMEKPEDVFVASGYLSHLLKLVEKVGGQLMEMTGDNLRLDSCKMDPENHPETLTVIHRYSTPEYLN